MLRRTLRIEVAVVLGALASVALVSSALAGDYHVGAQLHCSDCHIMHASKDGTIYGGGTATNPTGVLRMLKFASPNALCMSCHDGTDTTAPDVMASGTAAAPNDTLLDAYASPYKNSGGVFQSDYATVASNCGHNLGGGVVTATQGTWTSGATGMTCTDCHDPHGGPNYRNLKVNPSVTGVAVNVRSGIEVFLREAITVPATQVATTTHYDTSAVGFDDVNNITAWCTNCHTNIMTGNKHPQNVAESTVAAAPSLEDPAHWTGGTGVGFGTAIGDATAGIPRVRFGQSGTTYALTTTVATTNTVFCLSCHKAHGSKYDSTLVWPHYTNGAADQTAACGQCHGVGG